jgi:hypothetical protein
VHRETLTNGAIRLRSGAGAFLFVRLRPGVLLVVASGRDEGQFGDAPVDELSAELVRFPLPLQLFIDARQVRYATLAAQETWTAWFQRHRHALERVHMLSASRHLYLAASIAGHHSRAKLEVYADADAGAFELALSQAAREWQSALRDLEPATPSRRMQAGGGVTLDDGQCTFFVRPLAPAVVLLSIRGTDRGTLSSAVLDEIARARGEHETIDLFIDLRDASMPLPAVSELWASWFAANRKALSSVLLLSTTRPVSVTARIAQWRSRTGGLIRIVDQPDEFEQAVRRRVPGLSAVL